MKQGPIKESWNEFEWELELRKDDERVSEYMKELPRYIDLPAEDAVIMKHIQSRPDLVPHGGVWSPMSQGLFPDDAAQDEDSLFSSDDWQKHDGAELYIIFGRLARQWSLSFAAEIPKEAIPSGMRILCIYGKLMARSADMVDMEPGENNALKIAICKRLLSDVNMLIGEFGQMQDAGSEGVLKLKTDLHISNLLIMRDKIMALLEKTRSAANGNNGRKDSDGE